MAPLSVPSNAITFSEYPLGTAVTTQYRSRGVVFGGDAPFITTDGANPTSPVLSGSPLFQGAIEMTVVSPSSGARTSTNGIQLDVGYIDNANSVELDYFDVGDRLLGSTRANALGINRITIPVRGISRVRVAAVEDEPAGFAIDNVVLGTTVAGIKPSRMVSLGDSYTSGEGLLPENGLTYDCGTDLHKANYYENTNVIYFGFAFSDSCDTVSKGPVPSNYWQRPSQLYENLCHRHGRAWVNQVRTSLGIDATNASFVACSGAVTANVGYLTSGNRAQYPHSPNGVAGGNTQATDASNFARSHGSPDFITIGVGGNDAGFTDIVTHCLFSACLSDPNWGPSQLARIYNDVFDRLVTTFSGVRNTFPTATILTYGYPSVLDPRLSCAGIHAKGGLWDIGPDERTWAETELIPTLNQTIADAAATAGITFMPIDAATKGHEICTSNPWINGLRAGDDIHGVVANESFHPNQRMHDAVASFFLSHYTDGNGHLTFRNPAPNPTIPGGRHSQTIIVGHINAAPTGPCGAGCLQPACAPAQCLLNLNLQGFSPNTPLHVVIHSDPVVLGDLTSDGLGLAAGSFTLPQSLPEGDHTIEISGTSPDGVEQFAELPFVLKRLVMTCSPGFTPTTTVQGPVSGNLSVSGRTVINGASISGNLKIQPGADLFMVNSSVGGNLSSASANSVAISGSTIGGGTSVNQTAGSVGVGTVGACQSNTVGGSSLFSGNVGGLAVSGDTFRSNLSVSNNSANTILGGNQIAGNLSCNGDSPVANDGGQSNSVSGRRSGECASTTF